YRSRSDVVPLAQVDTVLGPHLECGEHARPALTVPECSCRATGRRAPGRLGDGDQRPGIVVDPFELETGAGGGGSAARLVGRPIDHDPVRWLGLDHAGRGLTGEVAEVPGDGFAGLEASAGSAGGEVSRELGRIGDGLVDL